ncbi:hypothetical protein B0A50_00047 [Salinomyces thailandicus]|uniref:glucan endo-1,3-beta-D-glucosidase n=1 Tax=Salinomyces thailandicus TaxID=706561 RepID=A0A4U0UFG8_9PEZI|nr:hypothetical protein B0A50_00047 [Salinomyces thailandica]
MDKPTRSGDAGQSSYFANPLGVWSIILSALELGSDTTLTTDSLEAFSVNVNLAPSVESESTPLMTFPLLQGMAFTTATYSGATPLIQSSFGFSSLTYSGAVDPGAASSSIYKYEVVLQGGDIWLLYVTTEVSAYSAESFTLDNGAIVGPEDFNGYIQVAKLPADIADAESIYDGSAGAYPISASISGSVRGTVGSYTLEWNKQGDLSKELLMFCLPHHLESLASGTQTDLTLSTTTKGTATAIIADSWSFTEPELPINMDFAPWRPDADGSTGTSVTTLSDDAKARIQEIALSELSQNVQEQTNQGSLYFDGKALAKFAMICYAAQDLADNKTLSQSGLMKVKEAFAVHVNNEMTSPLVYDQVWGGVVSRDTYLDGNLGDDFGNTIYNDHHFHFGYFVYTAAVIGYLDPDWLNTQKNVDWVNTLVRDYANSVSDDPYYPMQRMFDWYHGHSWAHGLLAADDGKDQESSSEDTMASYAIKMWGSIVGDENMEARGNLMLAVQRRSLSHYYLYANDNTAEPAAFTGNRAAGILFENKIDHTTYFGTQAEYIQGIHMLPLMPHTPFIRSANFVQQEWNAYFGPSGIKPVTSITSGWRGVLEGNRATVDPTFGYDFFSGATGVFQDSYLDGGASQTWYLAYAAALGGDPAAGSLVKKRDTLDADMITGERGGKPSYTEHGTAVTGRRHGRSSRSSRLRQRMRGESL